MSKIEKQHSKEYLNLMDDYKKAKRKEYYYGSDKRFKISEEARENYFKSIHESNEIKRKLEKIKESPEATDDVLEFYKLFKKIASQPEFRDNIDDFVYIKPVIQEIRKEMSVPSFKMEEIFNEMERRKMMEIISKRQTLPVFKLDSDIGKHKREFGAWRIKFHNEKSNVEIK